MNPILKETLSQFRNHKWLYLFAYLRSVHAAYEQIERAVPRTGRIIDVGCGYGIFADFLARSSRERSVTGLELNQRKLKYAPRSLPNLTFSMQSLDSFPALSADCIILYHVLHHLDSFKAQEHILRKASEVLNPSGTLVIVEVAEKPRWKWFVAWIVDHVLYPGDRIYYRSKSEFRNLFSSNGHFSVQEFCCDQWAPFSHVAFVARKPPLPITEK